MIKLKVRFRRYSEKDLRDWKGGRYSLVKKCFSPLKGILRRKASARPGRRFFGEAYVASLAGSTPGWYGSFKWLTAAKWSGTQPLGNTYQERFRAALRKHFPSLTDFQNVAAASTGLLKGRRPVGPDLWLVTPNAHRFIEVKLPGDRLARHQLVGLALIALFLSSDRPVSVEVAILYSDKKPDNGRSLQRQFKAVRRQLTNARNRIRRSARRHAERRRALRDKR